MTSLIYDKKVFSRNVKELRHSKKITQKQMAAYIEVRQSTISKWEKNPPDNEPYRSYTLRIAENFNVNLAWLLAGHGPKHPPKNYEFDETPPISTVVEQKGLHAKTRRVKTEEGEVAVSLYNPEFPAINKKDFENCAEKGCWAAEIGIVFSNEKELALRMCTALDYIQVTDRVIFEDILRKIFGSYEVLKYKESKKNSG